MDINRDNYEEYFLLYADDELTDSEKAAVLMFVKNNKDLEEEFRMIHHTISKPDANIKLDNKSFLLKNTSSFINKNNYEEVFVLYHDNELTISEKQETDEFLLLHKELKHEFDLIGMARLTPETNTVFVNKNILYKKEKAGRVVPLLLWRMLAAAVFIGLILWTVHLYTQKPGSINGTVAHNIRAKQLPSGMVKMAEQKIKNEQIAQSISGIKQATKKTGEKKMQAILPQKNNDASFVKTIFKKQKSIEKIINSPEPEKTTEEELATAATIKNINQEAITPDDNINPARLTAQNATIKNTDESLPVTYARNASYNANMQAKNDNYVFYDVTADEFKKTKVGGFLKKVKRVIARNSPIGRLLSGDDHQVASN